MTKYRQETMKTIVMSVQGMSCEHCKMTINKGLKTLPGITDLDIEVKTGRVEVSFDPKLIGEDAIKEEIRNLGYQVE
jgi:copper chaperone CopZ